MNNLETREGSIPSEIIDFFEKKGGHSLLVKGGAGTGKTTFVLQLLEKIAHPDRSFYLSTRVSDDSLYTHFPWLKDKEMKGRIIDSSRVLLDTLYKVQEEEISVAPEERERISKAKDFLKSISEDVGTPTKVDRTRLSILLERNRLPEIERVYDRIEQILPESSMLVIDSVEGVTHKYSLEPEEFINSLQKDLVENSGCNLLLVLEKANDMELEYLVDGVINVRKDILEGRRIREFTLEKLRATKIMQPNYLVTLNTGRFATFEPFDPDFKNNKTWEPIPDSNSHYSTGIKDMDTLLRGGFKKGSYNVIEVDENVSREEYRAIIRPIQLNFLMQSRGMFAVLTGGDHGANLKEDMTRFMPEEMFDELVRIGDYFVQSAEEPYIMALGQRNRDEAIRIYKEGMSLLRKGSENRPIIDFTGFDTVEYLQGGTVAIKQLLDAVAKVKISKDLGIGIIKPGLKLAQEIMNMADTYLKIVDINRCPCIFGIKPKTIIYAIVVDEELGSPHIRLEPIV